MPYTFQTVTIPNTTGSLTLNGINNSGELSGTTSAGAFTMTAGNASFYATGGAPYGSFAIGGAINTQGHVVGSSGHYSTTARGYLFDGSSFTRIEGPQDGYRTAAYGINDADMVAGEASSISTGHGQGFVWQSGTMSLFSVPGASDTTATGINNAGAIVGYSSNSVASVAGTTQPINHGFLDIGGQFSTIDVPGAAITDPMAINTGGTIVGSYNDGAHWRGFIDQAGSMTFIDAPGATDTMVTGINDAGTLVGSSSVNGGPSQGFIATDPPPLVSVFDTSSQTPVSASATPYTGPVAGLQNQYISSGSDSLNVTATTPNWFIHTGSGTDAIAASGGINVLDGGTGSNFLTGGTGTDTFFVDDRAASADIWSTVVGFHQGDAATIWGVTPQDFSLDWVDGQGAAGYTGLTLHATKPSAPTASLTLAGYSQADIASGRLTVQFGTDTASGSSYMYIHA